MMGKKFMGQGKEDFQARGKEVKKKNGPQKVNK